MAGREPEERVDRAVMLQGWRSVGFLHWRVEPAELARLLPRGVRPDVRNGAAWISITPFEVVGARPPLLPALPLISHFPETNLRTYVIGPDGADGIWFLSIEAATIVTTMGARAMYGAPYFMAEMSVEQVDGEHRYRSRRKGATTNIALRPGGVIPDAERTELDDVLTGRWRGYTLHLGRVLRTNVQHQPWTLHRAEVVQVEQTLTTAAGLPPLGPPDLVHWSPGVDTRLSRPRRVGADVGG